MLILQLTNFLTLQNMYSKPYMTCSHKKHCLPKSPQREEKLWEQFAGPEDSPVSFQLGTGQARPCRRLERACRGTRAVKPAAWLPTAARACISIHTICIFSISAVTSSTTLSRSNESSSGAELKFHKLPCSTLPFKSDVFSYKKNIPISKK